MMIWRPLLKTPSAVAGSHRALLPHWSKSAYNAFVPTDINMVSISMQNHALKLHTDPWGLYIGHMCNKDA